MVESILIFILLTIVWWQGYVLVTRNDTIYHWKGLVARYKERVEGQTKTINSLLFGMDTLQKEHEEKIRCIKEKILTCLKEVAHASNKNTSNQSVSDSVHPH